MGKNMAEPYQPTSSRLWKSLVMDGMAVVMMVWVASRLARHHKTSIMAYFDRYLQCLEMREKC